MTWTWDKEKFWVPDRNRTHDLPNIGRAHYPLSYENSWRARSFDWVHIWQVSCILLGSTLWLSYPVFRRSWVRFLSGTQNFSLSHAHVMLINSPSHFITELKIHHLYELINYKFCPKFHVVWGNWLLLLQVIYISGTFSTCVWIFNLFSLYFLIVSYQRAIS